MLTTKAIELPTEEEFDRMAEGLIVSGWTLYRLCKWDFRKERI